MPGKGEGIWADAKKIQSRYDHFPPESDSTGKISFRGAVRVICLAGPAGPGARARQAISRLIRPRVFAAHGKLD